MLDSTKSFLIHFSFLRSAYDYDIKTTNDQKPNLTLSYWPMIFFYRPWELVLGFLNVSFWTYVIFVLSHVLIFWHIFCNFFLLWIQVQAPGHYEFYDLADNGED